MWLSADSSQLKGWARSGHGRWALFEMGQQPCCAQLAADALVFQHPVSHHFWQLVRPPDEPALVDSTLKGALLTELLQHHTQCTTWAEDHTHITAKLHC